jgi:hypothetical protein
MNANGKRFSIVTALLVLLICSGQASATKAGDGCSVFSPCKGAYSCQPIIQKCYNSPRREGQPCSAGFSCGAGLRCVAGSQRCVSANTGPTGILEQSAAGAANAANAAAAAAADAATRAANAAAAAAADAAARAANAATAAAAAARSRAAEQERTYARDPEPSQAQIEANQRADYEAQMQAQQQANQQAQYEAQARAQAEANQRAQYEAQARAEAEARVQQEYREAAERTRREQEGRGGAGAREYADLPGTAENGSYLHLTTRWAEEQHECFESNKPAGRNDVSGGAHMDPCGNYSGQLWKLVRTQQHGYYQIKSMFTEGDGLCLEGNGLVSGASMGGASFMAPCGNVTGQLWKVIQNGDGYFKLQSMGGEQSNQCLEGNRTGSGSLDGRAYMSQCGNFSGQQWRAVSNLQNY